MDKADFRQWAANSPQNTVNPMIQRGYSFPFFFVSVLLTIPGLVGSAPARALLHRADDQQKIAALLQMQVDCWNRGDIDGFMETYWNSADLTFCSSGKITRGWQATKDRYRANYQTREKMGQLDFSDLEITLLADDAAMVVGSWRLIFAADTNQPPVSGKYTLVLKRIGNQWKIIHDHTSVLRE